MIVLVGNGIKCILFVIILSKWGINKKQRGDCSLKFTTFQSSSPALEFKRDDFLDLFNNHLNMCVLPRKEKLISLSWEQFQKIKQIILSYKIKNNKQIKNKKNRRNYFFFTISTAIPMTIATNTNIPNTDNKAKYNVLSRNDALTVLTPVCCAFACTYC